METIDIKQIRLRLGLSQEALAHKIGVTFQTINRWERGLNKPSPLALEKIRKLGIKNGRN